jgi:hypothetical protein
MPCGCCIDVGVDGRVRGVGAPPDSELARTCAGVSERTATLEGECEKLYSRQGEASANRARLQINIDFLRDGFAKALQVLGKELSRCFADDKAALATSKRAFRQALGVVEGLPDWRVSKSRDVVRDKVPEQDAERRD